MEGPLNEYDSRAVLQKANEITPAEVMCQIICHDENMVNNYHQHLYLIILKTNERPKSKVLSINTNESEQDVYDIYSESHSDCDQNNTITFVSYIHVYPQSPVLVATCMVTYRPTHETCYSPGNVVIIYDKQDSHVSSVIEFTLTTPPMSPPTTPPMSPTAIGAFSTKRQACGTTKIKQASSTTTIAFSTPAPPNTKEAQPFTLTLGLSTSAALLILIGILLVVIGLILMRRYMVSQQPGNVQSVIDNTNADEEEEQSL